MPGNGVGSLLSRRGSEKTKSPAVNVGRDTAGLSKTNVSASVTRILLQVRVRNQLVRRKRIQIPEYIQRNATRVAALPRPQIAAAGELAEAHEITAPLSLVKQLAGPLGQDRIGRRERREIVRRVAVGPLPDQVQVSQRRPCVTAATANVRFDVDEVRIREPEDGEIRVHHTGLRAIGAARC